MPRAETQNNGAPDDPVLLEAALHGDIEAFAELFETYRQRLHALCLGRLGDHSQAEDVVQEVFVRAYINLSLFDRRKKVWPWLATIAIRMCIDIQRRSSFTRYSEDIKPAVGSDSNGEGLEGQTGSALDAVIASERREEIFRSLKVLPKRQRRIFLLFALDGWSCADIAAAEGISLDAVHHLLFRARKKMRVAYQNGLPAVVALPFAWLHGKVQRMADRIRLLLGAYGEGLSTACMQAVCVGTAALMVVATSGLADSSEGADSQRFGEAVLSATQSHELKPALQQGTWPNTGASGRVPAKSQLPDAGPASSLVDNVIYPNQDATPESTYFHSIVVSPNYAHNHTIVASGIRGYKVMSSVLFTSRDGGASWKASSSRLLFGGEKVVMSPGYPQDARIFALGTEYFGLQQSNDGGEVFRTVSPVIAGSLAISPLFGKEDSKILLGASTLLEYDAGTGITRPASPPIPLSYSGGPSSVTFSPTYSSDRTVLVSDRYAHAGLFDFGQSKNALYRCREWVCDEILLPFDATVTTMKLSPRFDKDGLAYAFAQTPDDKLFVSKNGGRTFQDISLPTGNTVGFAVLWQTSSDPALFVFVFSHVQKAPVVFRSLDGGRSWAGSPIEISGFSGYYYGNNLIATPTGRLLAVGRGIACSIDLGLTWAAHCPPEP